jgi:hypothetical protein
VTGKADASVPEARAALRYDRLLRTRRIMVSTGLGLVLSFLLIRETGAARAVVVTYFKPAVAAVLGTVVLHEPFPLSSTVGLLMIVIGSWMSTQQSADKRSGAPAETDWPINSTTSERQTR